MCGVFVIIAMYVIFPCYRMAIFKYECTHTCTYIYVCVCKNLSSFVVSIKERFLKMFVSKSVILIFSLVFMNVSF